MSNNDFDERRVSYGAYVSVSNWQHDVDGRIGRGRMHVVDVTIEDGDDRVFAVFNVEEAREFARAVLAAADAAEASQNAANGG